MEKFLEYIKWTAFAVLEELERVIFKSDSLPHHHPHPTPPS